MDAKVQDVAGPADYTYVRRLAEGAYGIVFECVGPSGASVAVKAVKYHADFPRRVLRLLFRELAVLRTLPPHPCCVALLDAFRGRGSGTPYLVFELMDQSLEQVGWLGRG
ncbi:hypothetical protein GPECTOR_11g115 [Gonium pectorale]|uniref:Protein kinase domain-containing protein n=1 Tax=Gonium pectorale TaxID=33097 RepID=A0A150GPK1_GONPE|nr:hypothetical protein GPECTOR_11g115 [Gonium pectorale]|eukprot:KXZ51662.1 hypothetical protein GPECTOR_11g115 [Gonium pectorale]